MPTLADLRTRFLQRFDAAQNGYMAAAECNILINEGVATFYNWMVSEAEYYYWKEQLIPLVAKQGDYTLPADFMKLLKLYGPYVGQNFIPGAIKPIPRIMPEEYRGPSMGDPTLPTGAAPQGYMMMGDILRILPTPSTASGNLTMWYAPSCPTLVNDTDSLPLVMEPGFEEFIINQAVIGAKIKEDTDTSALERRQAQIQQQIQQALINRDMGRRQHVVDIAGPYAFGY